MGNRALRRFAFIALAAMIGVTSCNVLWDSGSRAPILIERPR